MITTFTLFFLSEDSERKDKCCARVIDVHGSLVWEVVLPACTMPSHSVRKLMSELPVIGSLCLRTDFLGSPRGKHCNSLEGIACRKFVPTSKKMILERDYRFFAAPLSKNGLG